MKKLLFGISLFLFANSVWAFRVHVLPETPKNVCARLQPQETQDACNNLISDASFDDLAVGVCNCLDTTPHTLECLKTIKDAPFYNHDVVNLCNRDNNADQVIACLNDSAGDYFEDKAVKACDRINDDLTAIDCLDAITGNTYNPGIVDKCDSLPSAEETVKCFDDNAKDATLEQLKNLENTPMPGFKRTSNLKTLNLRQYIPKCVPGEQNCHSKLQKDIQDSDDVVHRFLDSLKKNSNSHD